MKRYAVIACLVWLWLWSMHAHAAEPPKILQGLASVVDGDTMKVLGKRIRLFGIDAPERRFAGRWDAQPGADAAGATLSELCEGKQVTVISRGWDRYRRIVGDVYTVDLWINHEMVSRGHAWWSEKYAPHSLKLASAQIAAMQSKLGLWSQPTPIEPWVWRKRRR